MRVLRIASRASKLALAQTELIKNLIKEIRPGIEISIVEISTKGDRDKSDFLYKSESVGFFTSEVENAILDGRADLAVHSLKDLPTAITKGLVIAAIPKRDSSADALIAGGKVSSISELPPEATVGTSSLRRIAQLHHLRSDLKSVPLRGNVETRVSKVASGKIDAAILACAGLNRLGLSDKISAILDPRQFLTAPGQGALAVQVRQDDSELIEIVSLLDHKDTRIMVEAERAILAQMHGGCSIPLGVFSELNNDVITIEAVISGIDGKEYFRLQKSAQVNESQICANNIALELLALGGKKILDEIRNSKN